MHVKVFCILLALQTPLLVVVGAQSTTRLGSGEPCDNDQGLKCNKGQWLSCQEGFCACSKPDEMVYDIWKEKCVSKAGERCKFEVDETVLDPETVFRMFEKAECITNGQCGADGTCACLPKFYEAFNGTCVPQGSLGDQCFTHGECRSDKFLTCINETCGCEPTVSEILLGLNSGSECAGLAGQQCLDGLCTDNAECLDSICVCSPDETFYQDKSGRCQPKKSHGAVCGENNECLQQNVFLSCINGLCGCDSSTSYKKVDVYISLPNVNYRRYDCNRNYYSGEDRRVYCEAMNRHFDHSRYECVGKANEPCNANENCVENSICKPDTRTCQCNATFAPTSTGLCGLGHGQPCGSSGKVCSDKFYCTDGTCDCKFPNHQVHTAGTSEGKCHSLVAGPCTKDVDCIANTFCDLSQSTEYGLCECKPGFIENSAGQCDIVFGAACDQAGIPKCDSLASLKCRNEVCKCPDEFQVYDEKVGKCVGVSGSRCSPPRGEGHEQVCVENAKCVSETGHTHTRAGVSGRCKCAEGFELSWNRKCAAASRNESEPATEITTTAEDSELSEWITATPITIPLDSSEHESEAFNEIGLPIIVVYSKLQ